MNFQYYLICNSQVAWIVSNVYWEPSWFFLTNSGPKEQENQSILLYVQDGLFYLWMLITSSYLKLSLFSCCSCSQSLCCDLSNKLSQTALYCLINNNFSLWDMMCLLTNISNPKSAIFLFLCGKNSPKCSVLHFLPRQSQILHPFLNMWECVIWRSDLMYWHFKVNKLCYWMMFFTSVWKCTQILIYNWEATFRIPFKINIFKSSD